VTVALLEVPLPRPSEKSGPVPESATIRGLPVALSLMESVATRLPPVVGANCTLIEQLPPGLNADWQPLLLTAKSPGFCPPIETLVTVRSAAPVLVTCTTLGALLVPVAWDAKISEAGTTPAVVAPVEVAIVKVGVVA
jgi:hypothetical protein